MSRVTSTFILTIFINFIFFKYDILFDINISTNSTKLKSSTYVEILSFDTNF